MALVAETAPPAVVVADHSAGSQSAVSWAAVIAGGVAAVAMTLLLVALGTGIGLSTCRKFIRLWGGDVSFESTPGKGTTFYFTLPQRRANDERAA